MRRAPLTLCCLAALPLFACHSKQHDIARQIAEQRSAVQLGQLSIQLKEAQSEADRMNKCIGETPGQASDPQDRPECLESPGATTTLIEQSRRTVEHQLNRFRHQELKQLVDKLKTAIQDPASLCPDVCQPTMTPVCNSCIQTQLDALRGEAQKTLGPKAGLRTATARAGYASPAPGRCQDFRRKTQATVLIYDGITQSIDPPSEVQYDTVPVYLCIENPNYLVRYQQNMATKPLEPPPPSGLDILQGIVDRAPSKTPGTGGSGSQEKTIVQPCEDLQIALNSLSIENRINNINRLKDKPTKATWWDSVAESITAADFAQFKADNLYPTKLKSAKNLEEAAKFLKEDANLQKALLAFIYQNTNNASAIFSRLMQNAGRVCSVEDDKNQRDGRKLALAAAQTAKSLLNRVLWLLASERTFLSRDLFESWLTEASKEDDDLMGKLGTLRQSSSEDDKKLVEQIERLHRTMLDLHAHAQTYRDSPLRIRVPVDRDKETTVSIKGLRLHLRADSDKGATSLLAHGDAVELAHATVQVRSLVYVKASLGLIWTSLGNPTYRVGINELGQSVLQASDAGQILPTLFVSHYWAGADLRAVKPWDWGRRQARYNMIPTLAIGIPFTRNPIENLFVGLQWQPIPGISLVGGVHAGKVATLREGFTAGGVIPNIQGFQADNAVEQAYRWGGFIGAAISDSVLIKLILALAGGPK